MKLRLNDLKNFLEVAQCRTMSEAAQKLGITQPALSESIKRLESDLCETLLYRTRTGVTLTPCGRTVHARAKSAWGMLNEIQSVREQGGRFGARIITLGCHPLVASYCLPQALKQLQCSAPDYKIALKHDLSRTIQASIQQGELDLGIVINPTPSPDLIIRNVGIDEFAVWRAPGNKQEKIFCNLDLVQAQSILRKWKARPKDLIDTNSLELIVRLTSEKLGYGILPERAVKLFDVDLNRVDSSPTFRDTISIVYRPEFGKSKIERTLIDALVHAFAT
jgi:DNA-binding transcriptional LysR family regulator